MFLEKVRVFASRSNPTTSVGLLYFQLSTFFGLVGFFALLASSLGLPKAPCISMRGACGVAFRVAQPKSSRLSRRAESPKYLEVCMAPSGTDPRQKWR